MNQAHVGKLTGRPGTRTARCLLIAAWLATQLFSHRCHAADLDDAARENHLRAGYVFNFAKFVEWPAMGATDPLTVCFIGAAGVYDAFAASFTGKLVGTHRVVLRALNSHDATAGCHILYVEVLTASALRAQNTGYAGVLTVGDQRDFIHQGGIVELYPDNNRLRFNINLELAHRAGLKISSSLLQLASHVEETAP